MAIRICPNCLRKVPAGDVVAYTDNLDCPHCETPITVAFPSRVIGGFVALGVGWLVWGFSRTLTGEAGWVLPTLYTFLAYSAAYALYIMFTSDLVRRPVDAEPVPVTAAPHVHGGAHSEPHH